MTMLLLHCVSYTGYPIHYTIDYKVLLLCVKALNNIAQVYMSDLLKYKKPSGYSLRNKLELFEPRTKLETYGDRAFSSIGDISRK